MNTVEAVPDQEQTIGATVCAAKSDQEQTDHEATTHTASYDQLPEWWILRNRGTVVTGYRSCDQPAAYYVRSLLNLHFARYCAVLKYCNVLNYCTIMNYCTILNY